jgi:DNA polymerase III epsilon subunit-like protein
MKIFVFDTETTGLPVRDGDLQDQPYIVQFAGILGEVHKDTGFVEISREDIFIKPPIAIPFAASQVHGIYDETVAQASDF